MVERIQIPTREELRPHTDALSKMDALVDELLNEDGDAKIEKLEALIMKIQALIHYRQKQIDKKIATIDQVYEEEHRKKEVASYRGYSVLLVTLAAGGLNMGAGVAGLAPNTCFRGAVGVNNATNFITRGRVKGLFDLGGVSPDNINQITDLATRFFNGGAKFAEGGQSILSNRQSGRTTQERAYADRYRQQKQDDDQENTRKGSQVDDTKRTCGQREDARHQAMGMFHN